MKKLAWIFFVICFVACKSKVPLSSESNNTVIDFVKNNIGNKIDSGVCFDLVRKAYETKNPNWFLGEWAHKEKYKIKNPRVGDAIEFTGVIWKDENGTTNKALDHVGIVYKICGDTITFAEQNSSIKGDPMKKIKWYGKSVKVAADSKVILTTFIPQKIITGKIVYYRF